jgi:hypothetical protein
MKNITATKSNDQFTFVIEGHEPVTLSEAKTLTLEAFVEKTENEQSNYLIDWLDAEEGYIEPANVTVPHLSGEFSPDDLMMLGAVISDALNDSTGFHSQAETLKRTFADAESMFADSPWLGDDAISGN